MKINFMMAWPIMAVFLAIIAGAAVGYAIFGENEIAVRFFGATAGILVATYLSR
jgi:uncharacterized membrane protein